MSGLHLGPKAWAPEMQIFHVGSRSFMTRIIMSNLELFCQLSPPPGILHFRIYVRCCHKNCYATLAWHFWVKSRGWSPMSMWPNAERLTDWILSNWVKKSCQKRWPSDSLVTLKKIKRKKAMIAQERHRIYQCMQIQYTTVKKHIFEADLATEKAKKKTRAFISVFRSSFTWKRVGGTCFFAKWLCTWSTAFLEKGWNTKEEIKKGPLKMQRYQ